MSDAAARLTRELEGTVALLRESGLPVGEPTLGAAGHATLLEQCVAMCASGDAVRIEPVRLLHHLACTGGTLIAACLSSMPNVQMLGELDPLSPLPPPGRRPRFAPTDMITHLRQGTRPVDPALYAEVFRAELRVVHGGCTRQGLRLVLRNHAHSQYCTGADPAAREPLRALLPTELPQRGAVTVRDPRDSFASLRLNRWVQFQPDSFNAYCQRYLRFLDDHADLPYLRYEDFLADPEPAMAHLCEWLEVPYDPGFRDLFPAIQLTGNSGRAAPRLETRTRRPEAEALQAEAGASAAFRTLAERLGYI